LLAELEERRPLFLVHNGLLLGAFTPPASYQGTVKMIDHIISHYRILEKLDSGGMGVVYKAEDIKLKRLVALKFLPLDLTRDEEAKERFVNEAQAASALDHPNICTIHEIDESQDGRLFIAMAYYEGETLKQRIAKGDERREKGERPGVPVAPHSSPFAMAGGLPVVEVIDIVIQIAEGLTRAHEAGIVHRDIKPANVMITNRGEVKIIDFGLAKLVGSKGITKTPSTIGTVAYMSPEQVQGESVDHRTDIWSLGVVLYEMLTAQLPFKGDADQAVIYSIMNEAPEPMTALRPGLPIALTEIVEKTLRKDRDERFQSINELEDRLRLLKADSASKKIFLIARFAKKAFGKKSRAVVLAGTLLLVALLATFGYFFFSGLYEANVERIPIAVVDVMNETKEEELEGLSGMLITALEQSRRLSVLTRSRMFDVLKQMGKDDVDRIDETLGREICQRANVKTLVTSSIRKFGKLYTIDLKIIDLERNEHLFATHETGEGQESIPGMIDKLSEETRIGFKERSSEIRDASRNVAEITTINLDAYQHYFRGEDFINKLRFAEAEEEFEKAIAIDSTFGLAYYRLAYATWWRWGSEIKTSRHQVEVVIQKALALSDRMPEKERYLLHGLSANLEGGWEAEIPILQEMAQHYPNDKEMLYRLGDDFYHLGKYDSAAAYLEKVLNMDPVFERALQHLVRTYADLGQYEKMLPAAQKFKLLNEREGNYFIGEYYFHAGDYKTALRYMERMLAVPFNDWKFRRAVPYAAAAI
jgi:serine/threonine protein kinase